jgi:ABC transporter, ATP-binding protein
LQAYSEEHQAIVIISSHNIQHTIDISQRILLLEKGNIIKDLDNTNKVAEAELQTYFES